MEEHAVIVKFEFAANSFDPLRDLVAQLEAAIESAGVGEFDGTSIAVDQSEGSLYMYGPDADALYAVVRQLLAAAEWLRNARVTLRYGPPEDGVPKKVILLNA